MKGPSNVGTLYSQSVAWNDFHAWKAVSKFLFEKIGIRSVFHYNFKPSKNTSQKLVHFHNSFKNLFHSESLLVKSNLRPSLKLFDNVSGIIPTYWNKAVQSSIHIYMKVVSWLLMVLLTLREIWWTGFQQNLSLSLLIRTWWRWLSIVQAIHSTWKKQISNYGKRINEKAVAHIVIPNLKVKKVYAKLLRPLVQKPTSQKQLRNFLLMMI